MSETSTNTTTGSGETGSQTAGGTTGAQQTTTGAATNTDWTTGLSDDQRGYVQNKGFKAPQDVVESYRNFEKLHGAQEFLIKIPEKMEGDDARTVFQRLGMPKEAKDYNVQIPKELGDEKVAERIKEFAFKNNLTNRQVEALVQNEIEDFNQAVTQRNEATKQANEALKKEWGAAFEQNKNLADQGALAIGMDEKQIQALGQALGPDKAMKLLCDIAKKTGEATFVAGRNPGADVNTPASAQDKIKALIKDASFNSRLSNGDTDAQNTWDRLHKEAYPGQISL